MAVKIPNVIISTAVAYVLKQVASAAGKVNWTSIKATAESAVNAVVPTAWLDSLVDPVVDHVVDAVAFALQDVADETAVVNAAIAGDLAGAYAALVVLVEKAAASATGYQKQVLEQVAEACKQAA